MTEKEKMFKGKIYDGQDEELLSLRYKAIAFLKCIMILLKKK